MVVTAVSDGNSFLILWNLLGNLLALILKTINLFLPCKLIFWKSYQRWLPSKFSKASLWKIPQPQYFITLLLDPHWKCFWSCTKNTKYGFVPDWQFNWNKTKCRFVGMFNKKREQQIHSLLKTRRTSVQRDTMQAVYGAWYTNDILPPNVIMMLYKSLETPNLCNILCIMYLGLIIIQIVLQVSYIFWSNYNGTSRQQQ